MINDQTDIIQLIFNCSKSTMETEDHDLLGDSKIYQMWLNEGVIRCDSKISFHL